MKRFAFWAWLMATVAFGVAGWYQPLYFVVALVLGAAGVYYFFYYGKAA